MTPKPHIVGINHVALEVADIEGALHFYGSIFNFELRGCEKDKDGRPVMAFIDMGDQFLALSKGRHQPPDRSRHFGLVVDDRSTVRRLAVAAGATLLDGPFLDFLDPWGNRIEVVEYRDLQFSKTEGVLRSMGLHLDKTEKAVDEIRQKGMA
ncbi:glyoxalase/bleomycin resistance protein/dioxygenase [Rhizobium freirei PRF 81]|uniref:Glyoxalase/bleomycin resistance protein/dioxygenase n=1 Tax=Rhizobium freirei PRF 81 TaxID=363754 RepID=N6VB22_9HYPH|nr:VOC family protein [Rhizobium freirei]ENN88267.1 glyoxalase/bleomycin resistance protein/dioxygenase [Rhizobium freirei PRF 81]